MIDQETEVQRGGLVQQAQTLPPGPVPLDEVAAQAP